MKSKKCVVPLLALLGIIFAATSVSAADFDWTNSLNLRAQADSAGFRAQLSTRFKIGDAHVKVVLGNVDSPADAYMVFRLGEMSSKSVDYVLDKYKYGKGKGWGALAKSLGIKPGSKEFHALKKGSDLYAAGYNGKAGKKGKGNGKGKKKG
jgi:hypothetical protein